MDYNEGIDATTTFLQTFQKIVSRTTASIGLLLGLYWLVTRNGLLGLAALVLVAVSAAVGLGMRTRTYNLTYVEPLEVGLESDQDFTLSVAIAWSGTS
jgi:hypothetical protein